VAIPLVSFDDFFDLRGLCSTCTLGTETVSSWWWCFLCFLGSVTCTEVERSARSGTGGRCFDFVFLLFGCLSFINIIGFPTSSAAICRSSCCWSLVNLNSSCESGGGVSACLEGWLTGRTARGRDSDRERSSVFAFLSLRFSWRIRDSLS